MSLGYLEGESVYTRAFKTDDSVTSMKRGTFVKLNSAQKLVQATVSDVPLGVVLEDFSATGGQFPNQVWPNRKALSVRLMGTAFVEASAAIAAGQEVEVAANGLAAPSAGTNPVAGVALTSAAAAGDMIEVLLK